LQLAISLGVSEKKATSDPLISADTPRSINKKNELASKNGQSPEMSASAKSQLGGSSKDDSNSFSLVKH